VYVYVAERVHAGHAAGRLERHLGRGFPQHPSLHRREGHHAPCQSEAERIGAGEGAAECQGPSYYHGRHPAVDRPAIVRPHIYLSLVLPLYLVRSVD